jgi:hypothetical protein
VSQRQSDDEEIEARPHKPVPTAVDTDSSDSYDITEASHTESWMAVRHLRDRVGPKIWAVGVLMLLLTFAAMPFLLLNQRVSDVVLPNHSAQFAMGQTYNPHTELGRVTFEAQSVNPSDRVMRGQVILELSPFEKRQLRDARTHQRVVSEDRCPDDVNKPCLTTDTDSRTIYVEIHTPLDNYVRSVALPQLYTYDRHLVDVITLSLYGLTPQYPRDAYRVSVGLRVYSYDVELPPITQQFESDGMSDMDVVIGPDGSSAQYSFDRPVLIQLFVFGVAGLLPLLLSGALLWGLYRRPISDPILGFATAALLALTMLLLHPVLVPSSITVLTLADYSLGLSSVCMVTAVGLLTLSFRKHKPSGPE